MPQPARRFTLPSPRQGRGKPEDSRSLGEGEGRGRVVAHRPVWSGPRLVELDGAAERASHQLAAGLTGQDGAPVEGIEQHVLAGDARARDEVPGQADTLHLEPEAAPDLDQDQRERDGDAEAAIEHLVEVAVPGVVVLLRVPREALLLEEILPQPVESLERI